LDFTIFITESGFDTDIVLIMFCEVSEWNEAFNDLTLALGYNSPASSHQYSIHVLLYGKLFNFWNFTTEHTMFYFIKL